jgi:hypothetical protein
MSSLGSGIPHSATSDRHLYRPGPDVPPAHERPEPLGIRHGQRGMFSAGSLRARVANRLAVPADVDAYLEDVQPPTQAQFAALAAALAEHTALYEDKIQAICHKAFAHAGRHYVG